MKIYYLNVIMIKPLSIVIFDGSFKTTTFINRLAAGLSKQHHVYILGLNDKLTTRLQTVTYHSIGSNNSRKQFVKTTLILAFKSLDFKLIIKTFLNLFNSQRLELQKQNLYLVLERLQPDVIHLQWPSVIPLFESILSAQKVPVILSQRGYHVNVRPFVKVENMQYLQQWFPKFAGFHSVSHAISKTGDLIYDAPSKIDQVIYTGLPLHDFPYRSLYKKQHPLRMLSVGRPHWKKGYTDAIIACKLLLEHDIAFKYTIIGAAQDEELLFHIHDLGLDGHIFLESKYSQSEVYKKMHSADVLLVPSLEEGLANVAVEAMALGLPVISSTCGGMSELITDMKTGWLVPTYQPVSLADAVANFYKLSDEIINVVRKDARLKIEEQHTEAQMLQGMEQLYKDSINEFLKL